MHTVTLPCCRFVSLFIGHGDPNEHIYAWEEYVDWSDYACLDHYFKLLKHPSRDLLVGVVAIWQDQYCDALQGR